MLPVAVRRLLRTAAASSPVLAAPRLLCTAPTDADATPSSSSSSPPDQEVQEPTSFGFRTVAAADKAGLVAGVFSAVAPRYDVMNDLMSLGLHRGWKDRLVRELRPAPGALHLDVAGGTGDVAFRVLAALRVAERAQRLSPAAQGWGAADGGVPPACARPPPPGAVLVADINPDMLAEGRRRADAAGLRSADEALGEGGVPACVGASERGSDGRGRATLSPLAPPPPPPRQRMTCTSLFCARAPSPAGALTSCILLTLSDAAATTLSPPTPPPRPSPTFLSAPPPHAP